MAGVGWGGQEPLLVRNHGEVTPAVQPTNAGVRPWTDMRTGERATALVPMLAGGQESRGGPSAGSRVGETTRKTLRTLRPPGVKRV